MHVDMDAFFASVEQFQNHPELIGKPVCVGPDPRKGIGRGVVSTASYEARKFGIKSGMPVTRAIALCPEAVFVKGNFANYLRVSEEIMETLLSFADDGRIRKASIDEAYLEVTDTVKKFGSPEILARTIQSKIKTETNLPCSIGMGPNMVVAKIATSMKKPMGITIVGPDPADVARFLAPLPVEALNGVGRKTAERLNKAGIYTLGDIQQMSIPDLVPLMRKSAVWLHRRAWGIDNRPVLDEGQHVRKSIGKCMTFPEDIRCDDVGYLYSMLERICDRVYEKVIEKRFLFRTITVTVRYADFTTIQKSKSLPIETNDKSLLLRTSFALFEQQRESGMYIRLIGVRVSGLRGEKYQTSLTEFLF